MIRPSGPELGDAYAGRRVFVTGHTGFKGSWLALWLSELGAEVTGYALEPETVPSLFDVADVGGACRHVVGDVRDLTALRAALRAAAPDYVFHLAAQPLVRRSYERPLDTVETNVLGTANLLEAIRLERLRCAVVVVTSDKCYESAEAIYGYRESDRLGGSDVYSMSKGAAELVVSSWRRSFFDPGSLDVHGVAIATARAGNVIGGGDWAADRIVPDAVAALASGEPVPVRNPGSIRPWQHVLEPLGGYLLLGARLRCVGPDWPTRYCGAWNFGPRTEDARPVRQLVDAIIAAWGTGAWVDRSEPAAPREAALLRLSIEKAQVMLDWRPRWTFEEAIQRTVTWYRAFHDGVGNAVMRDLCRSQIADWLGTHR